MFFVGPFGRLNQFDVAAFFLYRVESGGTFDLPGFEQALIAHDLHGDCRPKKVGPLDGPNQHPMGVPGSMSCPSVTTKSLASEAGIRSPAELNGPLSPKKRFCEMVRVES